MMTDLTAGALAASLIAAARAGLLRALVEDEPAPAGELATRLGLDLRACERVLDVLVAEQLARRDGERYGAGPVLHAALTGGLCTIGELAAFWEHAPAFLRSGGARIQVDGEARQRGANYRDVVARLGRRFEPRARQLAAAIDDAYPAPEAILDVGAGSAVWSLAMAERHLGARVVAVDLPEVVPATRAFAYARGLADRLDTQAGDYREAPVPQAAFDRIVMANVLHLEPPEVARAVIARWAPALRPGGVLLVVDVVSDGSRDGERLWAAYALHLAMRSRHGYPHREPELRAWLVEAGLVPAPRIGDLDGPVALPAIASA
jgi:SAM-dependent methyltransferase